MGPSYKNHIEKYRDYYRQISSKVTAMELNVHGNPLILASVYIPHGCANDDRTRKRAWEDLAKLYSRNARGNQHNRNT